MVDLPHMRPAVLATPLLALVLLGCSTQPPELTKQQREDLFWQNYEKRLGLVGTDYADPASAKTGSVEFGWFICQQLGNGTTRDVLIGKMTDDVHSREEATAQVDTAVEFLCPEHTPT